MQRWVIAKTVPLTAARGGPLAHLPPTTTHLYWAGPHADYLPRATSWVWLTGLSPRVATFTTLQAAESTAADFAGPGWRTGGIEACCVPTTLPAIATSGGKDEEVATRASPAR